MVTKRKVAYATFWSAATIVLVTFLRLGSSIVSSRILEPSDFGIIAFVFAMNALLNQLSFFGVDSALVQKKEVDAGDLDVAWTFEFVRKNILVLIFLLATPVLRRWIDDPRVYWAGPLVAVGMFVASFRNNGIVIFRREFSFRQIFYLDVFPVVLRVAFIVAGLLLWPNIAVILLGSVLMSAVQVWLSYLLHEHRPRFVWDWFRLRGLLSFGSCLLGNTIVQMIRNQGVTFALAGFAGAAVLGFYNRGRVFCADIFGQINGIIWRVGYPLFSARHHSAEGVGVPYRSLTALLMCVTPAVTVLYAVAAPDIIPWLLSDKWNDSIVFVQLFCFESLLVLLLAPTEIAFQAVGKPHLGTIRQTAVCVLFLLLVYPATKVFGVKGVILAGIIATVAMIPFYLLQARWSVSRFQWESVLRWGLPVLVAVVGLREVYVGVAVQTSSAPFRIFVGGAGALLGYFVIYLMMAMVFSKNMLRALFAMLPEKFRCKLPKNLVDGFVM